MDPLSSPRDPWTRSHPVPDLAAPAASSVTVSASCRFVPLYPKEIFSDMCLSKYQLLKIKMRQIHELSKLAIPNYTQLSTDLTKQELPGKSFDKVNADGDVITAWSLFCTLS